MNDNEKKLKAEIKELKRRIEVLKDHIREIPGLMDCISDEDWEGCGSTY